MITVQEYLTCAATITQVVDGLISRPVAQMVKYRKSGSSLDNLIVEYESDTSKIVPDYIKGSISELTFLEMLALLRSTRDDDRYEFGYPSKRCVRRIKMSSQENYLNYVRNLLRFFMLCTTEKENRNEYLFGKMRIIDLYMYDSTAENSRGSYENREDYKKLCMAYYTHMDLYGSLYKPGPDNMLKPDATVREFLSRCYNMSIIPWRPAYDEPVYFIRSVRSAYNVAGKLLVDYFTEKYRDRYDMNSIMGRVMKSPATDMVGPNVNETDLPLFDYEDMCLPFD